MRRSDGSGSPSRRSLTRRFPHRGFRRWCQTHALPRRSGRSAGRRRVVLRVAVDAELRFLLPRARRTAVFTVAAGPHDTIGSIVVALGSPPTEVGPLELDGRAVLHSSRAAPGTLRIGPVVRPQRTASSPPRFLVDSHLGALARRLRTLGLDTEFAPHADDDALLRRAAETGRVVLTWDRALLYRAALVDAALVRGKRPTDQLDDVLRRFAPPLAPWTRCIRCNGTLVATEPQEPGAGAAGRGTTRAFDVFARCPACTRVYWRGPYSADLDAVIEQARLVIAAAGGPPPDAA